MIYRWPGFLAVVWFVSSHPFPPSSFSKLDRRHTGRLRKRDNLLTGRGKGVGEEPDHTTARKPSLNETFNTLWTRLCLDTFPVFRPTYWRWEVQVSPVLLAVSGSATTAILYFSPSFVLKENKKLKQWYIQEASRLFLSKQCFASGFGSAWCRIDFGRLDPDPGGQKWPLKVKMENHGKKFQVLKC